MPEEDQCIRFPMRYNVSANGGPAGGVAVNATGLPQIVEFDGPEGTWSPETLLCASVADCFILTFRALAKASKLEWTGLECRVRGSSSASTVFRSSPGSRRHTRA